MVRISLIVCVIVNVGAELHSVDHKYVLRKSRSNSAPAYNGYVYSQVNYIPGAYKTFSDEASDSFFINKPEKYRNSIESREDLSRYQHSPSISIHKHITRSVLPFTEAPISKYSGDYEIGKAEAKYNSKFLPSKIRTDAMYERLKSVMHYHPPTDWNQMISSYDSNSEYHIDDDDIRSSSRSLYDSWPHYYHSPYEYEKIKIDSEIEKAKDKRYAGATAKDIIPVHENIEEDNAHSPFGSLPTPNYSEINTDNPIVGDQPFFSFVLNDYFDKSNEEDSLVFKGVDWGKEFDNEQPFVDIDEYAKRKRRIENNYIAPNNNDGTIDSLVTNKYDYNAVHGESVTEKGYNNNQNTNKLEKADHLTDHQNTGYEENVNNYRGFNDFASAFANKFGAEDHKKDAKYSFKRNQDKGEKKKGFRKVYHKDEYQEENEFYDNNNNSVKVEESGNSNAHIGGLEALLQSNAATALGTETNSHNNVGNTKSKKIENNHKTLSANKGKDSEFNTYTDIAKKIAQNNNADYTDHYRI